MARDGLSIKRIGGIHSLVAKLVFCVFLVPALELSIGLFSGIMWVDAEPAGLGWALVAGAASLIVLLHSRPYWLQIPTGKARKLYYISLFPTALYAFFLAAALHLSVGIGYVLINPDVLRLHELGALGTIPFLWALAIFPPLMWMIPGALFLSWRLTRKQAVE